MMQHLTDLVKIINSGECYAFVGSGASCDMGVPSWKVLAERLHAFVCENCPEHDPKTYQEYLRDKRYPELFWLAEQDLGSYSKLIETIQPWFTAQRPTGEVYRYLARWPFACYLTTNFDDYLKEHLANVGVYYSTRLNTRTDLRSIRADASELILKIHGDFTDPENMVLTSKQYEEFRTGPQREYFRRKLGEIFGMVPVLIVGYSLKDPDIDLIISQASHYASPTNPIYMIVSDMDMRWKSCTSLGANLC